MDFEVHALPIGRTASTCKWVVAKMSMTMVLELVLIVEWSYGHEIFTDLDHK